MLTGRKELLDPIQHPCVCPVRYLISSGIMFEPPWMAVCMGCMLAAWGSLMKSGASLMAHFFFVLNSIPLSGCSTIYISIYLLKSQAYLLSFQALPIRNKGDIRICRRVLMRMCVSRSQGPASQLRAPRPGSHGPTAAPSGKPASPQQPCWASTHWAFSDSTRQLLSALDPSRIHFSRVF